MATWDNNCLVTTMRAGTITDPYISRSESFIIPSSAKILLSEIPDEVTKLTISGFSEVIDTSPAEDMFFCDYYTGLVTFNVANIGDSITTTYMGKGIISIPISRIYYNLTSEGAVDETLEDYIYGSGFTKQVDYQIGLIYGVRW